MALAERAVRAGWDVFAVGRRAERLAELTKRVDLATGTLATLALDLRTRDAARTIVQAALARYGRIDVLVNNAGGVAVGPIAEQSDEALREQVETHIVVPLALTREALPSLRTSRGQIFFVGSGVARIPVGLLGAYPPAKAAVRNLTRIVRNELRADGIAVTYVDPGAVATEFMTRAGFAGPPPGLAASPYAVARRIFAAFTSRQPVVNAVPWQTFAVAIGEAFPALTDFILQRAPQIVVGSTPPTETATSAPAITDNAAPASAEAPAPASFPPLEPPKEPAGEPPATAVELEPEAQLAEAQLAEPEPAGESSDPLEIALDGQRRRMERLNLRLEYVRELLVPGRQLELGEVALGWAGMPNKNERALTNDILDALAAAGLIEHVGPERYRVPPDLDRVLSSPPAQRSDGHADEEQDGRE
jgi:short-subunit dehydrogenase